MFKTMSTIILHPGIKIDIMDNEKSKPPSSQIIIQNLFVKHMIEQAPHHPRNYENY